MNREKAQQWMSAAMDGELSPRQLRRLERYCAAHPDVLATREAWCESIACLHTAQQPAQPPTAEAMWQDVRRALRTGSVQAESDETAGLWRMKWAGAVAVTLLLLVGTWAMWRPAAPPLFLPVAMGDRTEVEWVETDLPGAMSMVYEDDETGLTVIWVLVDERGEETGHAG